MMRYCLRIKGYSQIFILSVIIIFIFSGFLSLTGCGGKKEAGTKQPPAVEVIDVVQKDTPIYKEWVGTLDGYVNATIRAQVSGYLIKQSYREGDYIKTSQIMFEIDPRPFEASVEQVKGQLAQHEARWQTAKANLNRIRPLAERNAVSKKDLDDAIGSEQSTHASVLSAKAALDKAQLELSFTKIISPVDGIAGIAKAQIGNLVGPGQIEELTVVSSVNPIKCYIAISEQEYLYATKRLKKQVEKVPLEMILADGSIYPYKGEFAFADRQVDERTGTIKIAGLFPNPAYILRPGQFARVRAQIAIKKGALLIPQRAVTEFQGKYLVAVVGSDKKVAIRPVKPGERIGNLWIIDEGLKPDESIVVEGVQKVKDGMPVNPQPFKEGSQKQPEPSSKPESKSGTKERSEKK